MIGPRPVKRLGGKTKMPLGWVSPNGRDPTLKKGNYKWFVTLALSQLHPLFGMPHNVHGFLYIELHVSLKKSP